MKKLVFIVALMFSINGVSQVWFDLGVKGGVGSGFLINKTITDDPRLSVNPGFNKFFGGKVGVNFGEKFGIAFDFTFADNSYSFLQSELSTTTTYKYTIQYKSFNFAPLFRYTNEASYLEIGPQFSFLKDGSVSNAFTPGSSILATEYVRPFTTKMIFGFGGHMVGNEIISLMMGLRFSYMLSNLTNDTYIETTSPFESYFDITEASQTHPLDVQLVFELNYSLGYFVRASCGRRTAFLTF